MTDGIIQEWYKRYQLSFKTASDTYQFQVITKELIEKIKQEFGNILDSEIVGYDNYVLRKLIGDNQE